MRLLLAGAGGVGFAIAGVLLGRALAEPDPTEAPLTAVRVSPSGAATPADAAAPPVPLRRVATVVDPVVVGFDLEVGDAVVAPAPPPVDSPGLAEGVPAPLLPTGVAGAAPVWSEPGGEGDTAADPADPAVGAEPVDAGATVALDPLAGWLEVPPDLLVPLVDPCAGPVPGADTPEGCPDGTGATLLAIGAPPDSFLFFGSAHHLTTDIADNEVCPAGTPPAGAGQAAMTLFSRVPLVSATLQVRPHGSDEPWTDVPGAPASAPETRTRWMDRFTTREYDADWGTVPLCFVVDRPATRALEIQAIGVDLFDRLAASTRGIVPATDPQRPPTIGRISAGPTAIVEARTVEGGMVWFRSRIVPTSALDDPGSLDCEATRSTTPPDDLGWSDRAPFYPLGLYDLAYSQRHTVRIAMPVGGVVHVCAWIFASDNPLRPEAVDGLLLAAPSQQRPQLVLQAVRRWGDETIDRLHVHAAQDSSTGREACGRAHSLGPIPPGAAFSVEMVLWDCGADSPLPAGADGSIDLTVQVRRDIGSGRHVEEVAIRLTPDDCVGPACVPRPREWYEIPVPSAVSRLCGTGFGSDGCSEPSGAGTVVVRVEYPVVAGAGASGTVLQLDQVDLGTTGATARFGIPGVRLRAAADRFRRDATVTITSDRPVRLGLTVAEAPEYGDCGTPPIELAAASEFSDRHTFELTGLCTGTVSLLTYHVEEQDGTRWTHEPRSALDVPATSARWDVRVDFLGGPAEFGFLYRIDVLVDGQSTTAYWYDVTSPRRGTASSCVLLDGTTARSRGMVPALYLLPPTLDVDVLVHITTTGDGDCSGRSGSGLGELRLRGSFTHDDLRAAEMLVLESPADSPLRLRVTLTRASDWSR